MPSLRLLTPRDHDLGGGFMVRRVLPSATSPSVGPFVFFDHFGPVVEAAGEVHDVRPHPHIGLATVTYLFEGVMLHRDSNGAVQRIEPGAINWMTAGRGIAHSERTPDDRRHTERRTHGLQLWVALPAEHEETAPQFQHVPASAIPELQVPGATVRVLVGQAFGARSPVETLSPTLYLDLKLDGTAPVALDLPDEERAVYALDAAIALDGEELPAHTMAVLAPGSRPVLTAPAPTRVVVVGGTPLGHRHIVWNFVSSRPQRIQEALADWDAGRFPTVPGETEFIPLPERFRKA